MAISRAQMLKELLPGLNALFGLEYENTKMSTLSFMRQKALIVRSRKR